MSGSVDRGEHCSEEAGATTRKVRTTSTTASPMVDGRWSKRRNGGGVEKRKRMMDRLNVSCRSSHYF